MRKPYRSSMSQNDKSSECNMASDGETELAGTNAKNNGYQRAKCNSSLPVAPRNKQRCEQRVDAGGVRQREWQKASRKLIIDRLFLKKSTIIHFRTTTKRERSTCLECGAIKAQRQRQQTVGRTRRATQCRHRVDIAPSRPQRR